MTNRRLVLLATGVLVLPAAYFGYRLGSVPTETEIINRYAAIHVQLAGDGAAATDCAARPHEDPAIRMVITCQGPNGTGAVFYAGKRGEALPAPEGPDA